MFGTPNVRLGGLLFILEKAGKPFHFNRYNPGKKGGRSVEVEVVQDAPKVERAVDVEDIQESVLSVVKE